MRTVPQTKGEQDEAVKESFAAVFERILQSLGIVEKFNIKEDGTTITIEVVLKDEPSHHTFHRGLAYSLEENLQG